MMEEERTRREASVLRYREKRQSRLFSKKIRYQVRKLNADKRPRLKVFVFSLSLSAKLIYLEIICCLIIPYFLVLQGRFVKRCDS